jgi:hypothetical protein
MLSKSVMIGLTIVGYVTAHFRVGCVYGLCPTSSDLMFCGQERFWFLDCRPEKVGGIIVPAETVSTNATIGYGSPRSQALVTRFSKS